MSNNTEYPSNNGSVLTVANIIKAVVSSAAETGLNALFINCYEAIPVRQALGGMGHKQPLTPMQTENTTTHGFVTNNIASKRLKSMDTRIHWLICIALQGQLCHYWRPGPTNLGNYITKNPAAIHHHTACGARQLLSQIFKNLGQLVYELIIIIHKDILLSSNFQEMCVENTHL